MSERTSQHPLSSLDFWRCQRYRLPSLEKYLSIQSPSELLIGPGFWLIEIHNWITYSLFSHIFKKTWYALGLTYLCFDVYFLFGEINFENKLCHFLFLFLPRKTMKNWKSSIENSGKLLFLKMKNVLIIRPADTDIHNKSKYVRAWSMRCEYAVIDTHQSPNSVKNTCMRTAHVSGTQHSCMAPRGFRTM